ncbi:MAG TPA: sialate O-acetylesterase [Armatimonadota bacterium]|nr:sialate O-acetylesterase [Armatimonadota bacterium]
MTSVAESVTSLTLAALFSEGMVLQRERPLPIWGWAPPGARVAVALAGARAEATAGDDGRWRATLAPLPAGGPHTLTVTAGAEALTVGDILVGEVWICSGQSNMEWPLSLARDAEAEIRAADDPGLRMFTVAKAAVYAPARDVQGAWQPCTPGTAGNFSAVGYFFARELRRRLGIPVGMINASWGGTVAEAWTSREALEADPALRGIADDYEAMMAGVDDVQAAYRTAYAAWERRALPEDAGNSGHPRGWADPATDAADWPTMALPGNWQDRGLRHHGVVWFRLELDLPAAWAGRDLDLHLAPIDKSDITYWNNVPVGGIDFREHPLAWCTPRAYTVPGALVTAGRNTLAVRVFSHMYASGMIGSAAQMRVKPVGAPEADAIPLAGAWRYQVEQNFGLTQVSPPPMPPGPGNPNSPYALHRGMIAPLVPYALRGAIWYQGESNADRGDQYRALFPAMIADWRRQWGQGDFPFYYVQLANYMAETPEPGESRWAELREAQRLTLSCPNTGMAVIIDIGDAADIHPTNKQDVGLRLARWALAKDYGQEVVYSGPLYRAMRVEGGAIRLFFDPGAPASSPAQRLMAQDGPPRAFQIAGADRRFVWADAVIDGDTVVVSSPRVPAPVAVRYGWANNPPCNLYNAAGLPAAPFRTDDWPPSDREPQ